MSRMDLMANWPVAPACHGWLSLDRRGQWRLRGERVLHQGLNDFLNAYYADDGHGNWRVQNGPQWVYADLEYMPLVFRLDERGGLLAHTGAAAGEVDRVMIDEEGNVLLNTPGGPGLLDDRDLAAFVAQCRCVEAGLDADAALAQLASSVGVGAPAEVSPSLVSWQGVAVEALLRAEAPRRFRFHPRPRPREDF